MAIDAGALVERVIQRVLATSVGDESLDAQNGEAPEELIADALGNSLAQMLVGSDSQLSDVENGFTVGDSGDELVHYQDLVERNEALASALGACDCWGEQVDCDVCQGAGIPGWTLPDKQLFLYFVRPAVNAMNRLTASPSGAATQVQRQVKGGK